jgi:putative Mg2+ transporter-C (MgtC) family protein
MLDSHAYLEDLPAIAARLAIAWLLGALIGWDREARGRAAGLRTHMMVSLGACTFTLLGLLVAGWPNTLGTADGSEAVRLDPLRVVAAVIGGVGFLGAGAIIQARQRIRGVTTAAGIWVVAALGAAAGAGATLLALLAGILAWVTLRLLRLVEGRERAAPGPPCERSDEATSGSRRLES